MSTWSKTLHYLGNKNVWLFVSICGLLPYYSLFRVIVIILLIMLVIILYVNWHLVPLEMHRLGFKSISKPIALNYNYFKYIIQVIYTHMFWAYLQYNTIDIIFRLLTCQYRIKPDFFILGEQKCGTTTLCSHLVSLGFNAPFCSVTYPPHLLNKETQIMMGLIGQKYSTSYYYKMCFPLNIVQIIKQKMYGSKTNLYFDGTADHLSMPWITKRIYAINPNAKLIVIVRNPIDRLYSNYKHNLHNASWKPIGYQNILQINDMNDFINISKQNEKLFEELCDLDENEPLPLNTPLISEYCIVQRSYYAKNIKRYLKYFKREQM
eukprot:161066_1